MLGKLDTTQCGAYSCLEIDGLWIRCQRVSSHQVARMSTRERSEFKLLPMRQQIITESAHCRSALASAMASCELLSLVMLASGVHQELEGPYTASVRAAKVGDMFPRHGEENL